MHFNEREILRFLKNISDYSKSDRIEIMEEMLKSKDFIEWLYNSKSSNETTAQTTDEFYRYLCKGKVLKVLIDTLVEDMDSYDRTIATFIGAVANYAELTVESLIDSATKAKRDNRLKRSEYNSLQEVIEKYTKYIKVLRKISKRIVEKDALRLSDDCKIPKKLCILALSSCPNPRYLNKFKVGVFLNIILTQLYSYVDEKEEKFMDIFNNHDFSKYRWERFFKYVLGRENIMDVASFILLEGVHRMNSYKSRAVKQCWDSLTSFAFEELNKAPENIRIKMIELYLKRLEKLIANKGYDLRVNFLTTDLSEYPNLSKTINNFKEKIKNVMKMI